MVCCKCCQGYATLCRVFAHAWLWAAVIFSWIAVSSCSFVTRGRGDDFTIGLFRLQLSGSECMAYRDVVEDDEFRGYGWLYDWARVCGLLAPLCGMLTIALMLLDCCCKVCCSKYMQTFLVICCQFNQGMTFLIFASTACLSRKGVGQSDQYVAFCRMGSGSVMSLIAFWCYFIGGFLLCCSPKPDPCNKNPPVNTTSVNNNNDDDDDDDCCNTCCGRNKKEKKSKEEEAPPATTKAEENPQQQQEDVPEKKEEDPAVVAAAAVAKNEKENEEEPIVVVAAVEPKRGMETTEEEKQQEGANDDAPPDEEEEKRWKDDAKVVADEEQQPEEAKPDPEEENIEESRAIAGGDEEEEEVSATSTNDPPGEKNVPNIDEEAPAIIPVVPASSSSSAIAPIELTRRPQSPEPVEAGMEMEFDEEYGTSQVGMSQFY